MEDSFAWLVESEFLLPPRSHSRGAKGIIYSISENGVTWQVVPRAQTCHEIVFSIVDGKTVLFPGKAPFHHKLHL